MPKSKSRPNRRRHVERPFIPWTTGMSATSLEGFKEEVLHCELLIETAFPAGKATIDDVNYVRDFANLGALILARPNKRAWLDPDAIGENIPVIEKAVLAFKDIAMRYRHIGKVVLTGEELNAIRFMGEAAGEVIHQSLERCPKLLFKEYLAMRHFLHGKDNQTVALNIPSFNKFVESIHYI